MKIFSLVLLVGIIGCNNGPSRPKPFTPDRIPPQNWNEDSFNSRIKNSPASTIKPIEPIKILSSKIIEDELGLKSVIIKFKNTGEMKISAIRFKLVVSNAFNETATGIGQFDSGLSVGSVSTANFQVAKDSKNIIEVKPYEIAFSNGQSWKLD